MINSKFWPSKLLGSKLFDMKVTNKAFNRTKPISPMKPMMAIKAIIPIKAGKLLKNAFDPS